MRTDRGAAERNARALAVAAEFDQAAATYEEGRLAFWYQAQADMVMRAVGPLSTGLVVDVGCGTGWLLRQLLRDRPRLRGIGVDLSGAMVEAAREKAAAEGIPNLDFRQGDWERTPLSELGLGRERPRLLTCVSAFHYFDDPLGALLRMRRVLAPGGRLLLVDRDTGGAPMTAIWDFLHRYMIRDHCRFYRASELLHLLDQAGLDDIRIESKVRRWFWHGKALSSLAFLSAVQPGEPGTPRRSIRPSRVARAVRSGRSARSGRSSPAGRSARADHPPHASVGQRAAPAAE